ncbi:MAG: DNA polymerase III subunit beta [Peptoniphilaceae bacterium]|nr:DNA polymerase III subunit beta [Peptoniphilaceae bacterium]MDY3075807.1 DNA polymerase III subunit beta [Peptoniphilaceae bacterium]
MKFHVMPQELNRHINYCQRAISSRTTMPILECIHFEAKGDELILTATDLELTVQTRLNCGVEEDGEAVIPAAMIGNIFRKLPSQDAIVTESDHVVKIDCRDSHFCLNVPDAGEFPNVPEVESSVVTELDNDVIKNAVAETEFAASIDETKVALTGIYYERKQNQVHFVTLDGYRLAVRGIHLPEGDMDLSESVIIPKRAMNDLTRILDDQGKTKIRIVPGHIYFESGKQKLFSRLIDKNFINYEEIISTSFQSEAILSRRNFQDALERASLLTREERANLIRLTFAGNQLSIESNSEIGRIHETMGLEKAGEDVKIAFNAKYLLDGVKALSCEKISLKLNGPLNPLVIRPAEEEEDYLYLVLPVRVANE